MDLFRLPQPSDRVVAPPGEKMRGEPLPTIPEQFDPAAQAAIRDVSAQADTARHDGYMRVLVFGPLGVAAALIAELPVLPVACVVAAGVALASWLDRPDLVPESDPRPTAPVGALLPSYSRGAAQLTAAVEVLS